MPSANESMIANQAMGRMYEITVPYNPSSIEALNNTTDYLSQQRKTYEGKTLDKPMDRTRDMYIKDIVQGIQKQDMYSIVTKNQQEKNLYDNLMMGMYQN